ncbi:MAG: UPF0280 family protein [Candidatus Omnitrophota bacterium]
MAKRKDFQERFYRKWSGSGDLTGQEVVVKETDLFIFAEKDLSRAAEDAVKKYRREIEGYIKKRPEFQASLGPVGQDLSAPEIIREMIRASGLAGVGPMAAVAGAIAEFVGGELLARSRQVIIENGGDIFIKSLKERIVAIFAGDSPLSNKLFIKIKAAETPLGVCASSGTVGHSLSFGKADACVIISKSTSLADAMATAVCNRIKDKKDIKAALEFAVSIKGVEGALAIIGSDFGSAGNIELA